MARYRRYGRRYKRSTNVIRMKFQTFMDISTKDGEMQIISISAGGKTLLERLPAQFSAYKYYKIGNISVKLVPASTLPVDPSGLSYEPGENQIDPRDQLTPGMMRITNGEDIFEDISGLSADAQHKLYNNMMLDPRWFKWMLQTGVKRHATPRYWQIGQLHQDKWPGSITNVPQFDLGTLVDTAHFDLSANENGADVGTGVNLRANYQKYVSSPYGIFQTGHRGVLGWLPTDGMQYGQPMLTSPPEIEVMKIILPPAFATRYYYRAYISETVLFREPLLQAVGTTELPYRPLDVFHTIHSGTPMLPSSPGGHNNVPDSYTGGNYGAPGSKEEGSPSP